MLKKIHSKVPQSFVICLFLFLTSTTAPAAVIMFGIDETGSYDLRQEGIAIAKNLIRQLEPEDVLYIRRITNHSYVDQECTILRLVLPRVPEKSGNAFDMKAKRERQRLRQANQILKAQAIEVLDKLQPVKAPKTDIWGFFLAAQERLQMEEGNGQKLIILTSDMKDNVAYKPELKLDGIDVLVAGFENQADPKATKMLQTQWEQQLLKQGAASVKFRPADMPLRISEKY